MQSVGHPLARGCGLPGTAVAREQGGACNVPSGNGGFLQGGGTPGVGKGSSRQPIRCMGLGIG